MNNTNHPSFYKPKSEEDLERYGLFEIEQFIGSLKNESLSHIIETDSHISDHLGKTLCQQLEDICDDRDNGRRLMSSINDKTLMSKVIREALILHATAISKWVGVTGTIHSQRLVLRVDLFSDLWEDIIGDTESIGVRFNVDGNIESYKTPSYLVVLTRTEIEKKSPFGFSVRTVYPDIRSEHARPTDIDLQEYIKKTKNYKEGSAVKKAYLEHITEYNQDIPLIRYDENKTHEFITFALPSDSDDSVICLLDQNRTAITEYEVKDNGNKNNLNASETASYLSRHPKYKIAENKMRNSINKFIKEQNV